jgi:hypothetical protein
MDATKAARARKLDHTTLVEFDMGSDEAAAEAVC